MKNNLSFFLFHRVCLPAKGATISGGEGEPPSFRFISK